MIREILKKARKQRFIWLRYKRRLDEITWKLCSVQSPGMGERVQSSHQADLSEAVEKKEYCERREKEEREKMDRLAAEAADIIAMEPDEMKRDILYQRYIEGDSWKAITRELGYSEQHIFRLHAESLLFLEKMRVNESK